MSDLSQKSLQAVDSESDSVASEDDVGKKEEMKRYWILKWFQMKQMS